MGSFNSKYDFTASITHTFVDFKNITSNMWSSDFFGNKNSTSNDTFSNSFLQKFPFKFGIHPKPEMYPQDVMIHLWHKVSEEPLNIEYQVSILNDKKEECYTKDFKCQYDPKYGTNVHLANFMLYDVLIKEENGFVQNDTLTLSFEIGIVRDNVRDRSYLELQGRSISFDYQSMLTTGEHSDFVLVVGGKAFKVHKNILAARSSVFKAMFSAELEEKKKNRVEIIDVDLAVFEQLLNYIYTGYVDELDECALELFTAADKYQLEELKSFCAESLSSNITVDTVASILLRADMHSAPKLKSKCIEFITQNSIKIMATDGWKQLIKANRSDLMAELFEDIAKAHSGKASEIL